MLRSLSRITPVSVVHGGKVPALHRPWCVAVATGLLQVWHAVTEALRGLCDMYDKSSWEPMHAVDRYFDSETGNPLTGVVALLAEFGAVTGDVGKPVITPLGRWAADRGCRLGSPHVAGVSRSQAGEAAAAQASCARSRLWAGERGGTWALRAEHRAQVSDRRVLRVT